MKYKLMFFLIAAVLHRLSGQDVEDLVYTTPSNEQLNTFVLPAHRGNYKVVVSDVLYLLNENNIIIDTLNYSNNNHEQILTCFWVAPGLLSLNTVKKGSLIDVLSGKYILKRTVKYDAAFKKQMKKQYNLDIKPTVINILEDGFLLSKDVTKYIVLTNGISQEIDLSAYPFIESSYRNRIFANNYLCVDNNFLYIWNQFRNIYVVVNLTDLTTSIITPSLPKTKSGVNQVYYDLADKSHYLWAWEAKDISKLYRFDIQNNTLRLLKDNIPYIVRGIYNSKMYVQAGFEGANGHFLIPIWGKSSPVRKLDKIEIDH